MRAEVWTRRAEGHAGVAAAPVGGGRHGGDSDRGTERLRGSAGVSAGARHAEAPATSSGGRTTVHMLSLAYGWFPALRSCGQWNRSCVQYLGRFRREAFHGLEASGYVDTRIDPANVRRSGRTRQPTYEQEFKPAPVTAAAECAFDALTILHHLAFGKLLSALRCAPANICPAGVSSTRLLLFAPCARTCWHIRRCGGSHLCSALWCRCVLQGERGERVGLGGRGARRPPRRGVPGARMARL